MSSTSPTTPRCPQLLSSAMKVQRITRVSAGYGDAGVEFFRVRSQRFDSRFPAPQKLPGAETLEASQAVARLHGLSDDGVVYAQQTPAVIDQACSTTT